MRKECSRHPSPSTNPFCDGEMAPVSLAHSASLLAQTADVDGFLQRDRPPIARKAFLSFPVDEHHRVHIPGTWNPALPTTDLEDRCKELTIRIHRLPHLVWKKIGAWCRTNWCMLQLGPDSSVMETEFHLGGLSGPFRQSSSQSVGMLSSMLMSAYSSLKKSELVERYLAPSPITFLMDLPDIGLSVLRKQSLKALCLRAILPLPRRLAAARPSLVTAPPSRRAVISGWIVRRRI